MIETSDSTLLKKILPLLKTATVKGKSNDGEWVLVYYKAFADKTPRQLLEAKAAKDQNLDLHVYFGTLESINPSTKTDGTFCFTILSLTRVYDDEFQYRTFNVDRGEIIKFAAFPDLTTTVKVKMINMVEIPRSWLQRAKNWIKRFI